MGCFNMGGHKYLSYFLGRGSSVVDCMNNAKSRGLRYVGFTKKTECWGGNVWFHPDSFLQDDNKCPFICPLDPDLKCGSNTNHVIYDLVDYKV